MYVRLTVLSKIEMQPIAECYNPWILPLAVLPVGIAMEALASVLIGAAIAVMAWWIIRVLESEDLEQGAEWRYDVSRMNELRRIDPMYRLFYPVFVVLARVNRAVFRPGLAEIQRQVQASGLPRFWLPEEYLARLQV